MVVKLFYRIKQHSIWGETRKTIDKSNIWNCILMKKSQQCLLVDGEFHAIHGGKVNSKLYVHNEMSVRCVDEKTLIV